MNRMNPGDSISGKSTSMPVAGVWRSTAVNIAVIALAWQLGVFGWLGSVLGLGGAAGDGTSIDGLSFPPELIMGGVRQQLTGGGTRTKYGVAKVYAVALYVDSKAASGALKQYATGGGKWDPRVPKLPFYNALIKGPFARTLFLQFHRSVTGKVMAEAMSESLSKRLPARTVNKFHDALLSIVPGGLSKGAKVAR